MIKSLILLPFLAVAAPALAQAAPPPPPPPIDPATADRVADAVQSLTSALLDVRVGEAQAALEGRRATPAERRMTVRDLARRKDPNFDRKLQQRIAAARPAVHQSIEALNEALPRVMADLKQAQRAIERASANMPDPTYPTR